MAAVVREGDVVAHADRGRVARAGQVSGAGVDADPGHRRARDEGEIGGRVAELATAAVAPHDGALEPRRTAEQPARLLDGAGAEQLADARRRDRAAAALQERLDVDVEAEPGAGLGELGRRALRAPAVVEVLTHADAAGAERLGQHLTREPFGVDCREGPVEAQDHELVHAELGDERGPAAERRELDELDVRPKYGNRRWMEGHHGRLQTARLRLGDGVADHGLVAAVDAVEAPERDRPLARRDVRQALAHDHSTTTGWRRSPRGSATARSSPSCTSR